VSTPLQEPRPLQTFGSVAKVPKQIVVLQLGEPYPVSQEHVSALVHFPFPEQTEEFLSLIPKQKNSVKKYIVLGLITTDLIFSFVNKGIVMKIGSGRGSENIIVFSSLK
jgi:hypothetical protein